MSKWHSTPPGISGGKLVEVQLPDDLYGQLLLASVVTGKTLEEIIIRLLHEQAAIQELHRR